MSNPYQKEDPTVVHNIRQIAGCLPLLGCLAVGILGLIGCGIGLNNAGQLGGQPGWLIGAGVSLVGSGIGFGMLVWVVWVHRQT